MKKTPKSTNPLLRELRTARNIGDFWRGGYAYESKGDYDSER